LRPIISNVIYNELAGIPKEGEDCPLGNHHYSGLLDLIAKEAEVNKKNIIDMDVYFCDTTPSCLFGINDEYISSPRLDNLHSTYFSL